MHKEDLRSLDRDRRISRRFRAETYRAALVPTFTQRQASTISGFRQISQLFDPEKFSDLQSLHSIFFSLPENERAIVVHGGKLAIWKPTPSIKPSPNSTMKTGNIVTKSTVNDHLDSDTYIEVFPRGNVEDITFIQSIPLRHRTYSNEFPGANKDAHGNLNGTQPQSPILVRKSIWDEITHPQTAAA